MNVISVILLRSMIRLWVQYLELANKIDEDDFREIVLQTQKHKHFIKSVMDNAERGNIFMMAFFLRDSARVFL
jgi:hypothetical protein